ncbi:MAG: hypothetical protein IJQ82_01230, partial [Selenomonadaceae bacterium]|nr:hypothetical protein [Selenomonadaceae bacterium]
MMQARLQLAKEILNPADSVLIVTADEHEYLHLGCLLEEIFRGSQIQMITTVVNPKGSRRDSEFSRCEEYIFFVNFGNSTVNSIGKNMLRDDDLDKSIRWKGLLRQSSNNGKRTDRPNLFYPLIFEKDTGKFLRAEDSLSLDTNKNDYKVLDNEIAIFPISPDGKELTWGIQPTTFRELHSRGFIKFGKWTGKNRTAYYLSAGIIKSYENGEFEVKGRDSDGALILERKEVAKVRPLSVWNQSNHSGGDQGTVMLNKIIGNRFSFPK